MIYLGVLGFILLCLGLAVAACRASPADDSSLHPYVTRYSNGHLQSEAEHKNGKLHGRYRMWHENGQLFLESQYRNGKMEGPVTKWYPSGRLMARGQFHQGMKDGRWLFWEEDGKVQEVMYHAGQKKVAEQLPHQDL